MKMKIWIAITVVVGSIATMLFLAHWHGPEQVLHRQCLKEFDRTLKSPASLVIAERIYDGPLDQDPLVRPKDRMRYLIDSQNSYGALIRGRYACELLPDRVALREVDEIEWNLIPERLSPKKGQQACIDKAIEEYAGNLPLPAPQEIQLGYEGAVGVVTLFVSSPEWGSARFRCQLDDKSKVASIKMIPGLKD